MSGSLGSVVFSHNKGGAYMRNRVTPTKATTEYAALAKARMTTAAQAWQNLTADQQVAWREWTKTNPILHAIGQSRIVAGHVAYIRSAVTAAVTGSSVLDDPPVEPASKSLSSLAATGDIGAGVVSVVFTPSPIEATERLMVWAAVVDSPGINYVENLYKLVGVRGPETESPLEIEASIVARFGTLQVGQTLFVKVQVVNDDNLQPSGFMKASVVIETT